MVVHLFLLGLFLVPEAYSQQQCAPDKLTSSSSLQTCLDDVKSAGTELSPLFIPSNANLRLYVDLKFSISAYKLKDVCCQNHIIPSGSLRVNPLDKTPQQSNLMQNPPDVDFYTTGGFNIEDGHKYTYGLFDITGFATAPFLGSPIRPVLQWLVINNEGFKTVEEYDKDGGRQKRWVRRDRGEKGYGETVHEYDGPAGDHTYMFVWYNQTQVEDISVNVYDYVNSGCPGPLEDVCAFNLAQLIVDKELDLLGVSWVTTTVSAYDADYLHERYGTAEKDACLAVYPNLVSDLLTKDNIKVTFSDSGDVICAGTRLQVWQTYCMMALIFFFKFFRW